MFAKVLMQMGYFQLEAEKELEKKGKGEGPAASIEEGLYSVRRVDSKT